MTPVSRVNWGVPVTTTASLKVIVIAITSPILKLPLSVVAVTADTLGTVVSIISALFAPREFAAASSANVKIALFPAASLIVPLFSANAVVLL